MTLNKVKGNMYDWVSHTWNTVKGACPHGCEYCYMKKWGPQPDLHFDDKELKTDLGDGNFIFVGSSCDMFAADIPYKWIYDTLEYCRITDNRFLFQSKNPERIYEMWHTLPYNSILGTTIETNRKYPEMGGAPDIKRRAWAILMLEACNFETIITIEPIMDFDLKELVEIIRVSKPKWVNIGANTNSKVNLPEPPSGKVRELIQELQKFTEIKLKSNLTRVKEMP